MSKQQRHDDFETFRAARLAEVAPALPTVTDEVFEGAKHGRRTNGLGRLLSVQVDVRGVDRETSSPKLGRTLYGL